MSPRDRDFIVRLAQRGLAVDEIFRRVNERLVWDGPRPSVRELTRELLKASCHTARIVET